MKRDVRQMVYVIDDDSAVRDSTLTLLESAAVECQGFASASAFLEADVADTALCVVLDLHMPDMSGLQLLERLCADGTRTPVVLFSARVDEVSADVADRLGVIARLQKPHDSEALIRIVETLAGAQAPSTPTPGTCRH